MLTTRALLLVLFPYISVVAVQEVKPDVKVVFNAAFGNELGKVGKSSIGYPDRSTRLPLSFYVVNDELIYIADSHNTRYQRIAKRKESSLVFRDGVNQVGYNTSSSRIVHITSRGRIIEDGGSVWYPDSNRWIRCSPPIGGLQYAAVLGRRILLQNFDEFVLYADSADCSFLSITGEDLQMLRPNVVFSRRNRVLIGVQLTGLRAAAGVLQRRSDGDTSSFLADSAYIFGGNVSRELGLDSTTMPAIIQYDAQYNSYWYTTNHSAATTDTELFDRLVVLVFDRAGRLTYWFNEPTPITDWHHCAHIHVNEDGRIFRMNYHETEGIEIVEYLYR